MSSISPRKSCFCSSVAPSNYKKKRNKIDEFCYILAITLGREKTSEKKKALYLSVNVLSTKVLIGDTIFYVSNWTRDRHFTWSSEPREGLACCSAKGVPSFLGYFKTLSIGPAPGIEPATFRSAVSTLYQLN